jgi:hypothetical protein
MRGGKCVSNKSFEGDLWTWVRCKSKISGLRGKLGFADSSFLRFLGLSLSLEDGSMFDELRNQQFTAIAPVLYCILSGYVDAKPISEAFNLVSFRQLPGGHAYYNAFLRRAVNSVQKVFGSKPERLVEAAKLLGGSKADYGDCSVKIYSLPLVPITVVLWTENGEFESSANILFDSSVSNYLSTEQVAMLGELTSVRLKHANEVSETQK